MKINYTPHQLFPFILRMIKIKRQTWRFWQIYRQPQDWRIPREFYLHKLYISVNAYGFWGVTRNLELLWYPIPDVLSHVLE